MAEHAPFMLAVMGATATGKSDFAEALADRYSALLINGDAFQVYRGLDIGTAKPVHKDRYQLLDLKRPDEEFGLGEWIGLAAPLLSVAFGEDRNVIVVGGTGLYIRALFEGYTEMAAAPDPVLRAELERRQMTDGLPSLVQTLTTLSPETARRIDTKNPVRVRRALEKLQRPPEPIRFRLPEFRRLKVALNLPKVELERRIEARTQKMVHNGWVRELEELRDDGYRPEQPGFRAIGYRYIWRAMVGEIDLEEATAETTAETLRYAKRQRTWLRSEPGLDVLDLDPSAGDPLQDALRRMPSKLETEV